MTKYRDMGFDDMEVAKLCFAAHSCYQKFIVHCKAFNRKTGIEKKSPEAECSSGLSYGLFR
jgi:hypothetical protein